MKSSKWRVGGILLAVVILAGAVAGVAFADPAQETDQSQAGAFYDSFVAKLAANLGLEQDKVTAALDATKKQMLDEAVQEGKLTQEQADKIAAQKGMCGFGFKHKERLFDGHGLKIDGLAGILGLTEEQLKAEFEAGKKIEQIVTEHGLTMDQFYQKVLEMRKEAISKLVTEGKITQEQADKMLEKMERFKPE